VIHQSLTDREVGGRSLLDQLLADATLTASAKAKQGLGEMVTLFTFLEAYKITDKVFFVSGHN
jgi:hypothetical protein